MLREIHEESLHTHSDCANYIGQLFANRLGMPEATPPKDLCAHLLKHTVLIHIDNNQDKFNSIIFMIQKLFQVVQDKHKVRLNQIRK